MQLWSEPTMTNQAGESQFSVVLKGTEAAAKSAWKKDVLRRLGQLRSMELESFKAKKEGGA
jgi:hypothetical protein